MRAPWVGELRRDMELLTLEGKKDAFLRSVRLPMAVNASTVTATFKRRARRDAAQDASLEGS